MVYSPTAINVYFYRILHAHDFGDKYSFKLNNLTHYATMYSVHHIQHFFKKAHTC